MDKIDKYIARLLMISFFLPAKVQVAATFGSCIYFVVRTIYSKEYQPAKNYFWALFLGGLYLLYLGAVPFTEPLFRKVAHHYAEWRLSYLLLPIVFAIVSEPIRKIILRELPYFVYSCSIMCLIVNINFIFKYLMQPDGFQGVNHVTYRVFFELVSGLHPTYLSMYISFSLCILLLATRQMNKALKYSLFYLLLLFLLALFAKSPIIAIAFIFMHYAWLQRASLRRYKWVGAGVAIVMLGAFILVPFVRQRAGELVGFKSATLQSDVIANSISERKMIWNVDKAMLGQYWQGGSGPGRLLYLLKQRYFFYSLYYGQDIKSFDPHNEYFYEWLTLGLAGVLFLVLALVIQFVKAIRQKNYLYFYLLLIVTVTFFTESVLARQQGVIFYALFTSLFFFYQKKNKNSVDSTLFNLN